jgi:hypothetical protein
LYKAFAASQVEPLIYLPRTPEGQWTQIYNFKINSFVWGHGNWTPCHIEKQFCTIRKPHISNVSVHLTPDTLSEVWIKLVGVYHEIARHFSCGQINFRYM